MILAWFGKGPKFVPINIIKWQKFKTCLKEKIKEVGSNLQSSQKIMESSTV